MSIPYVPQESRTRFFVPKTLAADFDNFLNHDIPNTVMDFELVHNWYEKENEEYTPKYIRGEIYPDATKSRYENTDNNMNIRCSLTSGIRKGDMVIEPDNTIYLLDWNGHKESNNIPSRAVYCNLYLEVYREGKMYVDDEGYAINDEGYVVSGYNYNKGIESNREIVCHSIPANAYRYDGRPEYVAVSGTPGTIAGALTILIVQYNEQTKNVRIGDKFEWGGNTHEIVDVDGVGVDINQTHGILKFQAKRAAGGLHGYD